VADTLAEYGRIRGLPLNAPRAVREGHRTPYDFLVADRRVSLDVTGWEVASPGTGDAGGGDVRGPSFRRWCGSDLIWGHLMTGEQDSRVRRRLLQAGAFDDRTYYEEALAFADAFFRTRGRQRCVGVHLLFLDGWSHVALTTFGAGTWSRVYSLVFPGAGDAPDTEFAFFFFCREPFDHFCRHAYLMDELVLSLQRLAAGPLLLDRQPSRSATEP
jgi:hypothetical protein